MLATTTGGGFTVWSLFAASIDIFTGMLVIGSLIAVALLVRFAIEIRESVIAPPAATKKIADLIGRGKGNDLARTLQGDETMVARTVRAASEASPRGRAAMRVAAESEAGVIASGLFRKIELLNVIGNLGPLIGLAGTVWGMIIAFTSLGAAGGEAGPTELALGISKALFHTLLGLVLAIPCLLVFGIYRGIVDRICTRAMAEASTLVEQLPAGEAPDAA